MGTFYVEFKSTTDRNAARAVLTRHLPGETLGQMEDRWIYDIDGDAETALHRDLAAAGFKAVDFLTDVVAQMDADHKAAKGGQPQGHTPPPPAAPQTSEAIYPRHLATQENPRPNQPNPPPLPLAQLHTVQVAVPAVGSVSTGVDLPDEEAPEVEVVEVVDLAAVDACCARLAAVVDSEAFHRGRHAHQHGRVYVGMPLGCFYWFGSDVSGYTVSQYPGPESCDGGVEIVTTPVGWHDMLAAVTSWVQAWQTALHAEAPVKAKVGTKAKARTRTRTR